MDNSVYLKDISCKMFDFLCDVVGSAKVVKSRRLFFKIMEDIRSGIIISGSKAEGLNMKGSDIDIMIVQKVPVVFHCKSEMNTKFGLITDTENAAPEFVLLIHPDGNILSHVFTYTYSEYGLLVSSEEFRQLSLHSMQEDLNIKLFKIRGPCISLGNETDFAFCLKCATWHSVCMNWFHRPRYSTWPKMNDVAKMENEGLLYVPHGSKFGSENENSLEWRISFSVPEKILIHSFSQTQLICYALLKIILKEVINTNGRVTNLLCSYFMKTVMFWLAEESDPSSWNRETFVTCFQYCLDRLIYWVRIGYCPNYFIPEHNMFEGKIVGKCQTNLLNFLTILRKEGLNLCYRSATLSMFLSHDNFRCNVHGSEQEDVAIYPLLYYILYKKYSGCQHKIIHRVCGNFVKGGQLTKSLYLLWLTMAYIRLIETTPYIFYVSNKSFYRSYKLVLSHCLIAKNINVVYGGALLAAFFYRHKEYEKSLSVTNYALQECTPDKYFVHYTTAFSFKRNGKTSSNTSFHKLSCIYSFKMVISPQSALHICDLIVIYLGRFNFITVPSHIFIHYLRFMCFNHLGNIAERNSCLEDIKLTLQHGFLIYNYFLRDLGLIYFRKAARVANLWKGFNGKKLRVLHVTVQFVGNNPLLTD